jgi:hypothetical protein
MLEKSKVILQLIKRIQSPSMINKQLVKLKSNIFLDLKFF